MAIVNGTRSGCKDVFRAFLVKNATYDGWLEIPCLNFEERKPNALLLFSKAMQATNTNVWIHFYEDDVAFERIWNNPNRYLPILKRFNGVISPDFSVYRDMPLVEQFHNIYRSRAIAHWLQENGVPAIPNIRFGDDRTYATSCMGISKYGTIAIGSHGCIKSLIDRKYFIEGLSYVVKHLEPKTIVVYGAAPNEIFGRYREQGIEILQFDSEFMRSRKVVST